jgi:hypothetical protein
MGGCRDMIKRPKKYKAEKGMSAKGLILRVVIAETCVMSTDCFYFIILVQLLLLQLLVEPSIPLPCLVSTPFE